jgi:hypothetical protein
MRWLSSEFYGTCRLQNTSDSQMDVIGRISKDLAFKDAPIKDPEAIWQEAPRSEG